MTETKAAKTTRKIERAEVVKVLAKQAKAGEITQRHADLALWYFDYTTEKGMTLAVASAEIGADTTSTLSKIWHGTYGAKLTNVCATIESYKHIVEERAGYNQAGFVETLVAKRIFTACEVALISQTIVLIYGDSHIGKTAALEEYTKKSAPGQTKYVRLPASAGVQLFMREMARACFVSTRGTFEGMREDVLNAIDHTTLVIFDDVHQCFLSYARHSQIRVLEVIREIYDRTKCGMVLCGTNVLRDEIQEGKLAQMLTQLRRRCTRPVQLPARPTKPDLDKIARAFGLPEPKGAALELVKEMVYSSGVGLYISYLRAAMRMAKKQSKPLTWLHFTTGHGLIAKLSAKPGA